MEKINILRFKDKGWNSVLKEAEKLEKNSSEGKRNAHKIYASLIEKIPPEYSEGLCFFRGRLRKKIWDLEKYFGWNDQFSSQAGQDKFIFEKFFKYQDSGFFIEIGAYNGLIGSNCLFFEKYKKWKGIALEPSPTQYSALKKNRNCLTVNKAISTKSGKASFFDITSGFTQNSGLKETFYNKTYESLKKDEKTKISEIQVETITLDDLILKFNVKEIDYCSIDIEGGEHSILEKFDFSKYPIKVLSLENNKPNEDKYNLFLENKGYKFIDYVGVDEIWYNERYFNFSKK